MLTALLNRPQNKKSTSVGALRGKEFNPVFFEHMRATKQKSSVKCQCSTDTGRYIRFVYPKPFGCAM